MPVDPAVRGLLNLLEAAHRPSLSAGTPELARAGFRTMTVDARRPDTVVPVGSTEDVSLPGVVGDLQGRIYRPEAMTGPVPTVAFFHGGGFVIGDIDTHDNQCRWLCREAGAVVVSVGYRLAPEAPFPAAVEDCAAALRWVGGHVADLGGDASRLAVAGDSAGGNLAAVIAQLSRDGELPALAAQLLIYPAVDFVADEGELYPSRRQNAEGYFLTGEDMRWFEGHYAAGTSDRSVATLSPLHGDLVGLAPAVVVTAEYDPLRDEGEAYAAALAAAGVLVTVRRFDGMIHGFFDLAALSPVCEEAVRATCRMFRDLLKVPDSVRSDPGIDAA